MAKVQGQMDIQLIFINFLGKNIGPFLYQSLHFGYETGNLSQFQYQSIITCITKDGKDRKFIANWRPISLLNIDTKIASAAIAN